MAISYIDKKASVVLENDILYIYQNQRYSFFESWPILWLTE